MLGATCTLTPGSFALAIVGALNTPNAFDVAIAIPPASILVAIPPNVNVPAAAKAAVKPTPVTKPTIALAIAVNTAMCYPS